MAAYARLVDRGGRLPLSSKLFQGLGALPEALKTWAFNTFLLLFYNQVLGMPATTASLALLIAVLIDALTDPIVGSYSDGLKTRFGRRHPLMFAAVLPLAIGLYGVFSPPDGMSPGGLFWWLLFFAVFTRLAMTLFHIPWMALFAELSDDYVERSEIITYRYLMAGLAVVGFTAFTWAVIFPASPAYPSAQLNPDGYARLAFAIALVVAGSALLSALLTKREIPYLLQPVADTQFTAKSVIDDLFNALKNRNFAILFVGLLVSAMLSGTLEVMKLYLYTYFWGFTASDLKMFALAGIGALIAFAAIPWLNKRFDKKNLLITTMILSISDGMLVIGLRFLDILPRNGEPWLLTILVANEFLRAFLLVIIGVMFVSMIADTLDAQELETGKRQEGVFAAAISFSGKAISGFGVLIAGLLLDDVIGFPAGVAPSDIDAGVVDRLGAVIGFGIPVFYLLPIWLATRYAISRARHAEILSALQSQRLAQSHIV